MRVAARLPRRRLEIRPTTIGACEATPEVWMLLEEDCDGGRFQIGWKGRLVGEETFTTARGLAPSACGVLKHFML
jgi:hypothetical protein